MSRFFARLALAYIIERICERISPTELVELRLEPALLHTIAWAAYARELTPQEYMRRLIYRRLRQIERGRGIET